MRLAALALFSTLFIAPVAAHAQSDRGADVSANVSAVNFDERTTWSFSGAATFRITRVVGIEIEATAIPQLKGPFPGAVIQTTSSIQNDAQLSAALTGVGLAPLTFPALRFDNVGGRAIIVSNNVRVAIPTTAERLEPYFVAGGGVANTRRTADLVYDINPIIVGIPGVPAPATRTVRQGVTQSSTDLALTLGGGLSIRVADHVAIDGDLRLFRLLGDDDRNVGRIGVGVRYRF